MGISLPLRERLRFFQLAVSLSLLGALAVSTVCTVGAPAGATTTARSCHPQRDTGPEILALSSNSLVVVNPTTLRVVSVLDHRVLPEGGVGVGPRATVAVATAPGPDRLPAVWAFSLTCRGATLIEKDAELPAVSPDGGFLGYVTLDHRGRQTGVALVPIAPSGRSTGPGRQYKTAKVPPRLPIKGLAVGPKAVSLAVWGGFVDRYLGPRRSTVGTLDPKASSSLAALVPVFDGEGASSPIALKSKPEDWQSSPLYLPNDEFLVGDHSTNVDMPYTDTSPGVSGGGIRGILSNVGAVTALAAGPDGDLAWLTSNGTLRLAHDAINLPFGPQAEPSPPWTPPHVRSAKGRYTFIAWTGGPGGGVTAPPPVFHEVAHLPNVVGLSEPAAAQVMKALVLPVFISSKVVDTGVPANTVLAENPSAGTTVDCPCSIGLTVSTGGQRG